MHQLGVLIFSSFSFSFQFPRVNKKSFTCLYLSPFLSFIFSLLHLLNELNRSVKVYCSTSAHFKYEFLSLVAFLFSLLIKILLELSLWVCNTIDWPYGCSSFKSCDKCISMTMDEIVSCSLVWSINM